ncbi:hypothetical protein LV478_12920 [Komagataeibacter oboediens]|uniref:hypothetical protein n=1 Tax=Komagataeibacter oboediens TaxID=65958 RepID=UPI001C2D0535|nr:hypothetical protein [Komagataeibacter oboediens]MBV1823013.1 hypothetical protein [Komagataeibacter oboediens]WEQ51420.1 hypothetical protein LV478_12920 [Komagataeibacter oboediens]
MRRASRIFATLVILSVAGCHHHAHDRPDTDQNLADDYRNPHQHWSRGPHTDH